MSDLSASDVEYLLSAPAIRERAATIFELTKEGKTAFVFKPAKLAPTVDFVAQIIRKNYPDLDIPFHSRWGHFRAGGIDRVALWEKKLGAVDKMERARLKLDLVVCSVLLDAGAGAKWTFKEGPNFYGRSEGLGVASLHMFMSGVMSSNRKEMRADRDGLAKITAADIKKAFQVSTQNPLVGADGRALLLNGLARALDNEAIFPGGRPGSLIDSLSKRFPKAIPAKEILRAVLDGLGSIWPGRIKVGDVNLGDVWEYSKLTGPERFVPFHKLSQWLTYSLIEPIEEAGLKVTGVGELTGLAEYRNGGLMIDSGMLSLRNLGDLKKSWRPDSDLIIEWRALTVHLLDMIATDLQQALGMNAEEFPLAKVLEGGTWAAGRLLASEKRPNSTPPLNIESDGTVF